MTSPPILALSYLLIFYSLSSILIVLQAHNEIRVRANHPLLNGRLIENFAGRALSTVTMKAVIRNAPVDLW